VCWQLLNIIILIRNHLLPTNGESRLVQETFKDYDVYGQTRVDESGECDKNILPTDHW